MSSTLSHAVALAIAFVATSSPAQSTARRLPEGPRWTAGALVAGEWPTLGAQAGYRLSPHVDVVLAARYHAPGRSVVFDPDTTSPVFPGRNGVPFRSVYTDISVEVGGRLSIREEGSGLYLLPTLQYRYASPLSEEYTAALAREDYRQGADLRDDTRPARRHALALGSEVGYRFHFLRSLYADAAAAVAVRDLIDPPAPTGHIKVGLGARF